MSYAISLLCLRRKDTNYTKFLLDTNSTNYHEGFERLEQLVQIREIRVSISLSS